MSTINAHCLLTEKDYLDACGTHLRHASTLIGRVAFYGMIALLVLVTLLTALIALGNNPPETKWRALTPLVIGLTFSWTCVVVGRRAWRFKVRRQMRTLSDEDRTMTWAVDEDALSCRTHMTESRVRWERLKKTIEAPCGFLLYLADQQYLYLPGHAFDSAADLDRFANLARNRVVHYVVQGECEYPTRPEPSAFKDF